MAHSGSALLAAQAVLCAASHGLASWALPQTEVGLRGGGRCTHEAVENTHSSAAQVNIFYWAVEFSSTAWKFFYFLLMFMTALVMYT